MGGGEGEPCPMDLRKGTRMKSDEVRASGTVTAILYAWVQLRMCLGVACWDGASQQGSGG